MSNGFHSIRSHSSTDTDTPSGSEPRTIGRLTGRSFPSSHNLSSSYTYRAPARSFVQYTLPPHADSDNAQNTSERVRGQTAQLASHALSPTLSRLELSEQESSSPGSDRYFKLPDAAESDPDFEQPLQKDNKQTASHASTVHADLGSPHMSKFSVPRKRRKWSSAIVDEDTAETIERRDKDGKWVQADCVDERTPLLVNNSRVKPDHESEREGEFADLEEQAPLVNKQNTFQRLVHSCKARGTNIIKVLASPKMWSARGIWQQGVKLPVSMLPCVFLGVLLNLLDALSYGMILFPLGEPIFASTGPDGISMFYISCIVSQIVFSGGGSIFRGGVGSEMIEVVPFFHKMAYSIIALTGREKPNVVIATTITSFAASSVLTGLVFFGLGAFKLGSLVNFFPRHILIGCIGGVGFFLFVTGVEVSARLKGNLEYNLDTARQLFSKNTVLLWTIPLLLSIALFTLKAFIRSPYAVPAFFIATAGVFYITVATVPSYHIPELRNQGWIFAEVEAGVPWYHFYSYYDFQAVDWKAFASTIPAMFALTFFGILHVPINVPALAIAVEEDDLNLNRELVAHGVSNALSGFLGSIQNYLVYVNSDLFMSNGGNTRLAGFMLATATFGVLAAGPDMIGFVPVMVVGALIFYLGIELLLEALYETWGKMNKLEYLTVVAIVLTMGVYDFVGGILVGIVLACLFYVVDTSAKSAIRVTYSGSTVESTVRRHAVQRHFLHRVGRQIYVTKLAGTLFFGSIVKVEKQSRALIEEEAFQEQPIRFLIFDLAHVNGLDYSAAEAFTRMQRVLSRREVRMIMSSVDRNSDVGRSLHNVGLWQDESGVEFFQDLNLALESCENHLLAAFYRQSNKLVGTTAAGAHEQNLSRQRQMSAFESVPQQQTQTSLDIPSKPSSDNELRPPLLAAPMGSPRSNYLAQATSATLDAQREALPPKKWSTLKQPLPLLLHCMQGLSKKNEDFWFKAVPYFDKQELRAGSVLFHCDDEADAFYLLEKGMLKARYALPMGGYHESIVAGTTCGELPFFSNTRRTATVTAETSKEGGDETEDELIVVWALTAERWKRLQSEWPDGAQELLTIALRLTKERVDAVTGYVLTTAG